MKKLHEWLHQNGFQKSNTHIANIHSSFRSETFERKFDGFDDFSLFVELYLPSDRRTRLLGWKTYYRTYSLPMKNKYGFRHWSLMQLETETSKGKLTTASKIEKMFPGTAEEWIEASRCPVEALFCDSKEIHLDEKIAIGVFSDLLRKIEEKLVLLPLIV